MMIELIRKKIGSNDVFPSGKLISFLNPWSYLVMRQDESLLERMDFIYIDGISLVWLLRIFSGINTSRKSFDMTSIAKSVFEFCAERNLSVALIGSSQDDIEKARTNILARFPGLNFVSVRNGYFDSLEELEDFCDGLKRIDPEVIISGMGTPKQENLLIMMRERGWKGSGYTCGGFFHQTALKIDYYPFVFDKMNMRWLYRILNEPKLIVRYFVHYPIFFTLFLRDIVYIYMKNSGSSATVRS